MAVRLQAACAAAFLWYGLAHAQVHASAQTISDEIDAGYCTRALRDLGALPAGAASEAQVANLRGEALICTGEPETAQAEVERALAVHGNDSGLHRVLGEAYGFLAQKAGTLRALHLARSSLEEFEVSVRLDPQDRDARLDLATYYIQAPMIAGGSLRKAHEQEAALDRIDPVYALQARALEAEEDKDWSQAEKFLRQAADLDAKPTSLSMLGQMYLGAHRPADALQSYRRLAKQFPDFAEAWYQIGHCASLTGTDRSEGIAAVQRYLRLPQRPDTAPTEAQARDLAEQLARADGQRANRSKD